MGSPHQVGGLHLHLRKDGETMPQFKDKAAIRAKSPGNLLFVKERGIRGYGNSGMLSLLAFNDRSAVMGYSYFGIAMALLEPRNRHTSRRCPRYR
jgi:hypothetical protein